MTIEIPYGKGFLPLELPEEKIKAVIRCKPVVSDGRSEQEILRQAMENPVGCERLEVLAAKSKNAVILTSDHTRPVPSDKTLPFMIQALRTGNPDIAITILVATGTHRETTYEEMVSKFGRDIVDNEHIEVHKSRSSEMVDLTVLPSGNLLRINKIAADTDLLIADGFIEPHFFAGFSGGRKSLFPGVSCQESVMYNHCAKNIQHPKSRTGILEGNPIHAEMQLSAETAGLTFILNVILDDDKKIIAAFAGDVKEAHEAGCNYSASMFRCETVPSDIVITSNGGYPLDQNLYQSVKSMTAAESCVNQGGAIICAASCSDGGGGEAFEAWMKKGLSPAELIDYMLTIPPEETTADQWQAQILARVMTKATVIMVCEEQNKELVESMGLLYAGSMNAALAKAYEITETDDPAVIIPNGISVILE